MPNAHGHCAFAGCKTRGSFKTGFCAVHRPEVKCAILGCSTRFKPRQSTRYCDVHQNAWLKRRKMKDEEGI